MVRADLHSPNSIHKSSNNDVDQEHHLTLFKHVKTHHEHVGNISEKSGFGSWFQWHSLQVGKRRPEEPLSGVKWGAELGKFASEGLFVAPASSFGGKMVIPRRIPTFRGKPLLFKVQPLHRTCGWFFPLSLFPFHSFWADSINFPQWHVQPALHWRCHWWSPYSSHSREAIWMNICSPFSLHYKFSVVGKGAKCNGKASTEKCPYLRRRVL